MKSVLHVKIEAPTYSSQGMERSFKELFDDYDGFDWQRVRFNEGFPGLQQRIIAKAMMCQPELIFLHLQTPESIDADTAIELSKIGYVVNYTFDVRQDISWYKEIAPHIGLTLFGDYESIEECKREGINNVDYLQSSCDFDWYRPLNMRKKENTGEIVFLGGNYAMSNMNYPSAQERIDLVEFLQKEFPDKFRVYGMGWEGTKMVHAQDEIKIYNQAKIAITHNNFQRKGYTSDRLFRAIGCGAMTISQHYEGIEQEFNENILIWRNFAELKKLINFHLDNEDLREIRAANNQRLIRNTCNWTVRLQQMLKLIEKHGTATTGKAVSGIPSN